MKLNIIMTVYNRPMHLHAALQAAALQQDPDVEAIVVDDGSSRDSLAEIERVVGAAPVAARLICRQRDGFRLAAARNEAVRRSDGDYLVFLDCDIAILPGTLALHRGLAKRGRFLVGHRALLGEADTRPLLGTRVTAQDLESAWRGADKADIHQAGRRFRINTWLRRIGWVKRHKPKMIGCHFSLHRADIEDINGFDEQFTGWGLEDDDLALRLYAAGKRSISVIRTARALHLWHPTLQPDSSRGFASPNLQYFQRPVVPVRCLKGLDRQAPA